MVRSRDYFGVIRAIAVAWAVVGHRERTVLVASYPGHTHFSTFFCV